MSLSPFYFYEYSWVCVSIGNTGLPRETTHRACPRPLIPLLSFISPVLCHHHSSLFDTAQCCRLLFSSPLLPTYPHRQFLYLYLFHSTRFKNFLSIKYQLILGKLEELLLHTYFCIYLLVYMDCFSLLL